MVTHLFLIHYLPLLKILLINLFINIQIPTPNKRKITMII